MGHWSLRTAMGVFLLLVACILALGTPLGYALEPKDITGKWKAADGTEYDVALDGVTFILTKVPKKSTDNPKPYRGTYSANGMRIQFTPQNVLQVGDSVLPMGIRQGLFRLGYKYRADVTFPQDNTIHVNFVTDSVTYDRGGSDISSVNYDEGFEEVILSKNAGYKIGAIEVDKERFQRRVQADINAADNRAKQLIESTLPTLQGELRNLSQYTLQLQERNKRWTREVDLATAKINGIQTQITTLKGQLDDALKTLKEKEFTLWDQLDSINLDIRNLERRLLEPGRPLSEAERVALWNELEPLKTQQQQLENTLYSKLPNVPRPGQQGTMQEQLDQLAKDLRFEMDQRSKLRAHIKTIVDEGTLIEQRMRAKELEIENAQNEVTRIEHYIDVLKKTTPTVVGVEVSAGREMRFKADAEPDPEVLAAMRAQYDQVVGELYGLPNLTQELQRVRDDLKYKKNRAKDAMLTAGNEVIYQGDVLSALLASNANWRGAAYLGVTLGEMVIAGCEGGPTAILADLSTKLAETYVLGNGYTFQPFDETALRQRYLEGKEAAPDGNATQDFLLSQAQTTGLEVWDSGISNALERELFYGRNDWRFKVRGKEIAVFAEAEEKVTARAALKRAYTEFLKEDKLLAQEGERVIKELLESEEGYKALLKSMNNNMFELRKDFVQAILRRKEALRQVSTFAKIQNQALPALKAAQERLTSAAEHLNTLKTVKFWDVAKGVGIGLAADNLRSYLMSRFDAQEEAAWEAFFKADVDYRTQYGLYRKAAAAYWNAEEQLKEARDYHIAMYAFMKSLEQDMHQYVDSKYQRDGLHVAHNLEIFQGDGPLNLHLKIFASPMGENSFLQNSPWSNHFNPQYAAAPWNRQGSAETDRLTQMGQGNSFDREAFFMQNTQRLATEDTHVFMMNASELPKLKPSGDLPLRIEPQ